MCSFEPVKWTRYGPASPGRHRHEVDLRPAEEADGALVVALADHGVDGAEPEEPVHHGLRLGRLDEQVEVPDRLLLPPE